MIRGVLEISVFLLLMLILSGACEKTESVAESQIEVILIADTTSQKELNFNIVSVQLSYSDETQGVKKGWYELNTKKGIYNLSALTNDTLIAEQKMQVGTLSQIRLIPGNLNFLSGMNDTIDLIVPAEFKTGIKLNVNKQIEEEKVFKILLEFDVDKSIFPQGNGSFLLKPVIKIKISD